MSILQVRQGGTGVAVAASGTAFLGPVSGVPSAPGFRQITASDLSISASGDLTGNIVSPSLASITTAKGPVGDAGNIPIITIDAKGRVTALSSVASSGGGGTGTGLSVLNPTPSGTYVNPTITVNNYGLVTAVSGNALYTVRESPSGNVNGVNTVFTLINTPVASTEMVFVNGALRQAYGNDYTISGKTITFTTAPLSGSTILVTYNLPGTPTPPKGASMILCAGWTPVATGPDYAEYTVPYDPQDGVSSVTWNVRRITWRASVSGSSLSTVAIEYSSGTGGFVANTIGSITLPVAAFEANVTSSLGTTVSGRKIRFNTTVLGDAQNWTIDLLIGA